MALCHNCDDVRNIYTGNGVQKEYEITFEYYSQDDVAVANWDEENLVWVPVDNSEWVWQHETLIRFNDAPAFDQQFIIYRCTDLEPLPAEFYPGTQIKAQDLNDNFFVLKTAIEEARCSIDLNDSKAGERYWDKVDDTITYEQQINGEAEALLDDEHIFDAEAIAARHDSYVQDDEPAALPHQQAGKIWNDTDGLQDYFWDPTAQAWISFTKTGPSGPPGGYGPPGKVIISDIPPTSYPAVGTNEARDLESGDFWFDSYNVLLYVYYIDAAGPGQWVSTTKTGPQGEPGQDGQSFVDVPFNGVTYGRRDKSWIPINTSSGAEYKGLWTDPDNIPSNATDNGDYWIWAAPEATLNNELWGSDNGSTINTNDRIIYNGSDFDILSASVGGGLIAINEGLGINVNTSTGAGTTNTPEVNVKFTGTGADNTTLVVPANTQLLSPLP